MCTQSLQSSVNMDIHAAEEDNIIKEIIKVSEALSAIETKDYSDNKWIIDLLKVVKDPNLIMVSWNIFV